MQDSETTPHYTEGVCGDGVVILRNGVALTISQVLDELNNSALEVKRLHIDKMRLLEKYEFGRIQSDY